MQKSRHTPQSSISKVIPKSISSQSLQSPSTVSKQCCGTELMEKIDELTKSLNEHIIEIESLIEKNDDIVKMSVEGCDLTSRTQTKLARVNFIETEVSRTRHLIQAEKLKRTRQKGFILLRKKTLNEVKLRYEEEVRWLDENWENLGRNRDSLQDVLIETYKYQAELVKELMEIYPIVQCGPEAVDYSIRGIPVPNSDFSSSPPDSTISTALFYISHFTHLLSHILSVPLRYPITMLSSRSTVTDSTSYESQTYPLYLKNQDLYKFEYAVFLLNKNIEGLVNERGMNVLDLRNTLGNLKMVVDSVLGFKGDRRHGRKSGSGYGTELGRISPYISPLSTSPSSSSHSSSLFSHAHSHSYTSSNFLPLPPSLHNPAFSSSPHSPTKSTGSASGSASGSGSGPRHRSTISISSVSSVSSPSSQFLRTHRKNLSWGNGRLNGVGTASVNAAKGFTLNGGGGSAGNTPPSLKGMAKPNVIMEMDGEALSPLAKKSGKYGNQKSEGGTNKNVK
ncbi:UV radiation resistance protein and autophagy-related subunit 14-domain-containing protein [Paraphysoderma sedebokerense]|nr:UV radiation resistance protein and autophagy-related subunit 14-domain-containing protein [Paraphysoderma sedebokerense]